MVIERIEDELVASLRRNTPGQRLAVSFDMWRYARDRLIYVLRSEHPEWDTATLNVEFKRRMLGST